MARLFIATGVIILLMLLTIRPVGYRVGSEQSPEPVAYAAQGSGALTIDEIEPIRRQGIEQVENVESASRKRAYKAHLLLQAAIILGALVSIAAGFQRIVKAREQSDLVLVTVIALCGALAALCTSFGSQQDQVARTGYDCARKARGEMITVLRELSRESDALVAQNLLSSLGSAGTGCNV